MVRIAFGLIRLCLFSGLMIAVGVSAPRAVTLEMLTSTDDLGFQCVPEESLEVVWFAANKGVQAPRTCLRDICSRPVEDEDGFLAFMGYDLGIEPEWPAAWLREYRDYRARYGEVCEGIDPDTVVDAAAGAGAGTPAQLTPVTLTPVTGSFVISWPVPSGGSGLPPIVRRSTGGPGPGLPSGGGGSVVVAPRTPSQGSGTSRVLSVTSPPSGGPETPSLTPVPVPPALITLALALGMTVLVARRRTRSA